MKKCSKCGTEKSYEHFYKHPSGKDGYTCRCKQCMNKKHMIYYRKNKKEYLIKVKERYNKNKEYIINRAVNYQRNKYKDNITYRLHKHTISSIRDGIIKLYNSKKSKYMEYLCCDWKYAREHIEKQFAKDMNWDNYNKYWNIDHIIPISFFNIEDVTERKLAYHWGNIRPVKIKTNESKSNKIKKLNFNY